MAEHHEARPGYKLVRCRYRKVRNSDKVLDARDYGYECWMFYVRDKKPH